MTIAPSTAPASLAAARPATRFLLVAFFVSGATSLVFEVVWMRDLGLLFGATALAVASILAAYMAGLGLGGFLGGRVAARLRRPLLAYGLLEAAVALYALGLPALLHGLAPLTRALYQSYTPHFSTFSLLRFGLAFAALLVPTTLMGATLPVLARAVEAPGERGDLQVGRLYAANTFGALAGTLLAGFYLVPALGLFRGSLAATLAGLALSAVVLLQARRLGALPDAVPAPAPAAADSTEEGESEEAISPFLRAAVLVGFGLSGATSMAGEVLWSRALVQVIGGSTYAFSTILAAFLGGISLGSALVARRAERLRDPLLWLGLVEVLAAAATLLALNAFEPMTAIYRLMAGAGPGGRGPLALGVKVFACTALILPTALCLGAAFPLAVSLYARGRGLAARVGELYGANTLGCIAGSLVAGFLLVPRLGLERGLALAAAVNLAVGLVLLLQARGLSGGLRLATLGVLVLFGAVLLLKAPRWDLAFIAAGSHTGDGSRRLLFWEPGYSATISVNTGREAHVPTLALRTDGKTDASDFGDLDTQVQLALVPLIFHPDPKDFLVIGFATGTTCGAVLKDARVQRMDVLEIEPAMLAASHYFDHMNGRPLEDPRTHVIENDARNYYRVAPRRYDAIVSEPSNPWLAGPSHLFTAEAFREAHQLLRPGGVMVQWMQAYSMQPATAASILRAFREAFPHVRVISLGHQHDTLLLGSEQPLALNLEELQARMVPLQAELARTTLRDAWSLAAELVGDERSVDALTAGAPANTDDNGFVEFHAPRDGDAPTFLTWLTSTYEGPGDELLAQGRPAAEIGARLAFRQLLYENLEPVAGVARFLDGHGQPAMAQRVRHLRTLTLDAAPPATRWEAAVARLSAWLGDRPQPPLLPEESGAEGLEAQFAAWVAPNGSTPAAVAPPFRFLAAERAAAHGDCAALREVMPLALRLRESVLFTGFASNSANARALARAFSACGDPDTAATFTQVAERDRASFAADLLQLTPPQPLAALALDPESTAARLMLAQQRCAEGDAAGELEVLTPLVQLEGWRAPQVQRLAFLSRDLPADHPARKVVAAAWPYVPAEERHPLERCPQAGQD